METEKEKNIIIMVLEYEGEYKNGERSGKGKEYNYKGQLKYLGQYLNGKWNGKGKEYNWKGELEFQGEFLNGKRWNGIIKNYYCENNNYVFRREGEYKNGDLNGKGKEYEKDTHRLIFEGEYLNGYRHGKGKEYY